MITGERCSTAAPIFPPPSTARRGKEGRRAQAAGGELDRDLSPLGSCRSTHRTPRFSNIGVLRRLAIDSGHASRSGSKAARSSNEEYDARRGGGFVTMN